MGCTTAVTVPHDRGTDEVIRSTDEPRPVLPREVAPDRQTEGIGKEVVAAKIFGRGTAR